MARAWATRRKAFIIGGILLVLLVGISVPAFFYFDEEPTCFDGKQNQGEVGVDCGGPCVKICASQTVPANVLWSRAFRVADGVYNAVAYVENPNFQGGARNVGYRFRVLDEDNLLIAERTGTTFISPRMTFPVFEASIQTGARTPSRTFFEFTENPSWETVDDTAQRALTVQERTLFAPKSNPRLEATIVNRSVEPVSDVTVVAVIFDGEGNAMAASKTAVDGISGNGTADLVFTWPEPMPRDVVRIDVVPRVRFSDE